MPKQVFAIKDCKRISVLRPDDPNRKLNGLAHLDKNKATQSQFDRLLTEQAHTFIGYLSHTGKLVLNEDGNPIGELEPGDSFVGFSIGYSIGDRIIPDEAN